MTADKTTQTTQITDPKNTKETNEALKIGFIGLGIMGTPMAEHLLKAKHALFVFKIGRAHV